MDLSEQEETRLLKLAKKGDVEARNKLVAAYLTFILRMSKRNLRGWSKLDLPDLVQEGALALIGTLSGKSFDPKKGRHRYFGRIISWRLQNALRNYHKDYKMRRRVLDDSLIDNNFQERIAEREDAEERLYRIGKILRNLSPRDRKIVSLYFGLSGDRPLTPKKIVKALGVNKSAVHAAVHNAVIRLRQTVQC